MATDGPWISTGACHRSEYAAYLSRIERADERTRTADPNSLRVIIQALQGFAQGCKSPIDKPVSLLCFASCCTVLRSRWYQSGIKYSTMVFPVHP